MEKKKMTHEEQILIFNKIGFISNLLIELNDILENTNVYRQNLKMHLKGAIKELEKISNHHGNAYMKKGDVEQSDGTSINSADIYNITAKAYDYLFDKEPYKVVVIADFIRKLDEKKAIDWLNQHVDYKPLIQ